ncbi:(2Fe-2S)-binding protein [Streptomyces gobiensis]|uniref:(2Fe-2S)-binding protein n=1 Tax=Streptomyces gobiensis TaxID=2875706 RepID=UPI001E2B3EDC|nr:(2Fe-2S)-binding protein [Streptomyces gobiensis]UGY94832.1 (2Fe-2S)-binding protein [Streptomyces gobiensis]
MNELTVNGTAVPLRPGQTIGAALHAAGVRLVFCGIGVCFSCVVTVNGSATLRACVTEARPGDEVVTGS